MKILRETATTRLTQDGGLYSVYTLPMPKTPVLSTSVVAIAIRAFEHYEKKPNEKFLPWK